MNAVIDIEVYFVLFVSVECSFFLLFIFVSGLERRTVVAMNDKGEGKICN